MHTWAKEKGRVTMGSHWMKGITLGEAVHIGRRGSHGKGFTWGEGVQIGTRDSNEDKR